jgi:hypothetical protein
VIREFEEGATVWIRASADPESQDVMLTVRARVQVLDKMGQSQWLGGGSTLSVEVPEGTTRQLKGTCLVPQNGALVIGPLPLPKGVEAPSGDRKLIEGRELCILVSASVAKAE